MAQGGAEQCRDNSTYAKSYVERYCHFNFISVPKVINSTLVSKLLPATMGDMERCKVFSNLGLSRELSVFREEAYSEPWLGGSCSYPLWYCIAIYGVDAVFSAHVAHVAHVVVAHVALVSLVALVDILRGRHCAFEQNEIGFWRQKKWKCRYNST
eukprot:scaffold21456_cov53-Attheya_sp.AAC.2